MNSGYLFRVLRSETKKHPAENVEDGIKAKRPEDKTRLSTFVRQGTRMRGTQFIATTTDLSVAINWARKDMAENPELSESDVRIAIIDVAKLTDCEVLDMSTRESGQAVLASREDEKASKEYIDITLNFSTGSREVDIVGTIRPDAFKVYTAEDINKAMRYAEYLGCGALDLLV